MDLKVQENTEKMEAAQMGNGGNQDMTSHLRLDLGGYAVARVVVAWL